MKVKDLIDKNPNIFYVLLREFGGYEELNSYHTIGGFVIQRKYFASSERRELVVDKDFKQYYYNSVKLWNMMSDGVIEIYV